MQAKLIKIAEAIFGKPAEYQDEQEVSLSEVMQDIEENKINILKFAIFMLVVGIITYFI
jgi:hypothetical protein